MARAGVRVGVTFKVETTAKTETKEIAKARAKAMARAEAILRAGPRVRAQKKHAKKLLLLIKAPKKTLTSSLFIKFASGGFQCGLQQKQRPGPILIANLALRTELKLF